MINNLNQSFETKGKKQTVGTMCGEGVTKPREMQTQAN